MNVHLPIQEPRPRRRRPTSQPRPGRSYLERRFDIDADQKRRLKRNWGLVVALGVAAAFWLVAWMGVRSIVHHSNFGLTPIASAAIDSPAAHQPQKATAVEAGRRQ